VLVAEAADVRRHPAAFADRDLIDLLEASLQSQGVTAGGLIRHNERGTEFASSVRLWGSPSPPMSPQSAARRP
jgi:hypothetical protein